MNSELEYIGNINSIHPLGLKSLKNIFATASNVNCDKIIGWKKEKFPRWILILK